MPHRDSFLALIIAAAGFAWPGLTVSYTVEILPFKIRAKGLTLCFVGTSLAGIFNQYVNPVGLEALAWKFYFVYIAVLVLECLAIYFLYVETRGPVSLAFSLIRVLLLKLRPRPWKRLPCCSMGKTRMLRVPRCPWTVKDQLMIWRQGIKYRQFEKTVVKYRYRSRTESTPRLPMTTLSFSTHVRPPQGGMEGNSQPTNPRVCACVPLLKGIIPSSIK